MWTSNSRVRVRPQPGGERGAGAVGDDVPPIAERDEFAEFQVIAAAAQQFLDEFEAGAPALEVTAPADLSRDI